MQGCWRRFEDVDEAAASMYDQQEANDSLLDHHAD
jgi:hypothetical protein